MCASLQPYKSKLATSVVGTFKNGTFHGPGKVVFEDGSVLLSDFKNGSPAGLTRTFLQDGKLQQVVYENVVEKGYKWLNLHPNYLFYTDVTSFLNNHNDSVLEPNCVIVPITANSKFQEILVGNINLHLGYLDNIYETDVNIIDDYCILKLDWKPTKKKDFIFFYANDTKISLNNFKPNCFMNENELDKKNTENVEKHFTAWNHFLMDRSNHGPATGLWNFLHLFHLKPEKDLVNSKAVQQPFISNMNINCP